MAQGLRAMVVRHLPQAMTHPLPSSKRSKWAVIKMKRLSKAGRRRAAKVLAGVPPVVGLHRSSTRIRLARAKL